jgi:hypothetical protein
MGQSKSIFSNNYNDINNSVLQTSKSYCVNICLDNFNINKITVNNSDISGTVELKVGCVITGASCVLKSALTSEIIDKVKNDTDALIKESTDIFSLFSNLSSIGSKKDIRSSNYNVISNQVTQNLLSVCMFRAESNNNINVIDISNAKVSGSINIDKQNVISNTKCTQDNMIKSYVENSVENKFKAKIEEISCCQSIMNAIVGIVAIIAICMVFIGVFKFIGSEASKKKKKDADTDADADADAADT